MDKNLIRMSEDRVAMFFPLARIAEDAYMQTSVMGRAYDAETKQFLLESVQLTPDRKDIHSAFVEEALYDMADRLSAFIKPDRREPWGMRRSVRTANGLHFFSDTVPPDDERDGRAGIDRVAIISYANSTLYHYEDNLETERGDVVYEPVKGRYYLCLQDGVVGTREELQDARRFMRLPCFEVAYLIFDRKRWQNELMYKAAYNAIQSAFTDYLLYKWLSLSGSPDMAGNNLAGYSGKMEQAASRLNSQKAQLGRSMNII